MCLKECLSATTKVLENLNGADAVFFDSVRDVTYEHLQKNELLRSGPSVTPNRHRPVEMT